MITEKQIEEVRNYIKRNYRFYTSDWTYERSEGNFADCFEDGLMAGISDACCDIALILGFNDLLEE